MRKYMIGDVVELREDSAIRGRVVAIEDIPGLGQSVMVEPDGMKPDPLNHWQAPAVCLRLIFAADGPYSGNWPTARHGRREDTAADASRRPYAQFDGRTVRRAIDAGHIVGTEPVVEDYAAHDQTFTTEVMAALGAKYQWEALEIISKLKEAAKAYLAPKVGDVAVVNGEYCSYDGHDWAPLPDATKHSMTALSRVNTRLGVERGKLQMENGALKIMVAEARRERDRLQKMVDQQGACLTNIKDALNTPAL